jgi:PKD repeat protein
MKYKISYFALIKCLILTLLLLNHNSTCQNVYSYCDTANDNCGTLSFFVYDSENGYGVPSVIIFTNDKDTFNLKTDNGGHLMFNGREGKYDITIYAADYNPLQTYFYIEKGICLDIKIILEKQNKTFVEYQKYEYPIIEGYVVDSETGMPLSDVKVTIEEENNIVYTDEKGFFSIMPKKSSIISDPNDEVVRNNITFSKNDYKTEKIKDLLIVPDKIKLIIHLQRGEGIIENKKIQHILDEDMNESKNIDSINYNQEMNQNIYYYDALKDNRSTCNIPTTIRVGTNCSCLSCTGVTTMSLQYYSESGLDDEWIASWHIESLKAGSIPYRTYGGYYVQHPVSSNFDIASSTCNQVWNSDIYTASQSAAQATTGKILTTSTGTTPVRSEYSAENNYGGSSYNCSNGYAGGSGAYPCYSDNICSGTSPSGHGRGMCQWGSQRWANNGKDYNWIVNHYYIATVNYRVCSNSNPPPVANFEANPTSICAGNSVQFTNLSTNATSYNWTFTGGNPSSSTNANPVVIYTNPGNYSVTLIATGPGGSNTMTKTNYITVNPKPNISIYATRDSICKGDTTIIFATGGDSYLWSHNLGSQPMVTIMPEISTTYFATATNSFNCSNVDSISIIVNQPPNISINAQPSTICQGDTAIITATGAHHYYWSSNANNDIINVSPNNSTSYIVTGYSDDGCSSSVSVAIIVKPIPPKPIIIITNNSPFTLMSTSDIGNQWYLNDNPISGATDQTYIVNEDGNYFTVVTIDGCSSLPSNQITINNVGINDYANDEILIYPNPAQDIIYIQYPNPINEVMIINNLGQIVAHYSEIGIINIGQLANGVYQIMIKTEDNIVVLPLIKIH